jgi:hypothetical protein
MLGAQGGEVSRWPAQSYGWPAGFALSSKAVPLDANGWAGRRSCRPKTGMGCDHANVSGHSIE